ncbi:hypothetical protein C2G38_2189375 [Gigaspora rosea]|uniref:Uncharacterized protein n=1 Tax=Gigaspora rosea TaxID=44941 RepID=A0A397V6W7_9GLOM|nr:hypothetical protein C2G38_2189375 [Gigaspora rosea]
MAVYYYVAQGNKGEPIEDAPFQYIELYKKYHSFETSAQNREISLRYLDNIRHSALCKNTKIISSNFQENNLGLEGGKKLAIASCKNSTLASLNNGYNNLGSKG